MKFNSLFIASIVSVGLLASCTQKTDNIGDIVTPADDNIVRILAIGNSFSEDALDTYFHDVCEGAGKKVIVGNLYIPGCPIDRHMLNADTDSAAYRFRRIGLNGDIIEANNIRLSSAIGSDDWDFVTFQQASGVSGKYDTYKNLKPLIYYVDSLTDDNTRFAWHQTWAYSADSKHGEYPNYECNQKVMYDSIMIASSRAVTDNPELTVVIPSGTAIQIAREKSGNYDLTRDGYHLDNILGRYIAACTWFEALFGESVVDNKYIPEGLTPEEARLAREAAHEANLKPFGK